MLCVNDQGPLNTGFKQFCIMCADQTRGEDCVLCEDCSNETGECEICRSKVSSPRALVGSGPSPFFVNKTDKDTGCTVSLKVGEELHVELPEELPFWGFSPRWEPVSWTSPMLTLTDRGTFSLYPGDGQRGSRTIIFTANRPGESTVKIEKSGATTPSVWTCTVKVK